MKKLFSLILSFSLLISVFSNSFITNAEETEFQEGCYTYTVFNDEAIITGCDTFISGDIVIPSILGGYPVTSIGNYAFDKCFSLTSITIPDSVTGIGSCAFQQCFSLEKVNITDLAKWCSIDFKDSYSNPLFYAHNLYLNGELISDIEIPDGVTRIGDYAFSDYNGLTNVTIPDSVTSIGDWAFANCYNLTSINIPDGVAHIGDDAFLSCRRLTSITIPDSVTRIGDHAFCGCRNLTSINIPENVTSIGKRAFSNCMRLTNITIPKNVISIGEGAFNGCYWLELIYVDIYNNNYSSQDGVLFDKNKTTLIAYPGDKFGGYVIPESVIIIGNYAFSESRNLTSITIPKSVTSIGDQAFAHCYNLSTVVISDNVKSIGERAFIDCSGLASITIPESVVNIGYYAFFNGPNSINVDTKNRQFSSKDGVLFNKSQTTLIFYPNDRSGEYIVPDSVISIGDSAFSECSRIESIVLPDGVEFIENSAFSFSGLTNITIPASVSNIGEYSFSFCDSLKDIYYKGSETEAKKISIGLNNDSLRKATWHYNYGRTLDSISIQVSPTKTNYYIGEALDTSGMQIELTYSNGTTEIITGGFTTNGFSSSTVGEKTIVVSYEGLTDTFTVNVIKRSASNPNAPILEKKTFCSVTLVPTAGYEYKIDNGKWQDSNVFNGLNPNKTYTFYQRVKETNTTYASESSTGTAVTTLKMPSNKPNAPTVATKTHNSVTLTATNGYEYKIDNGKWQDRNVFNGLNPNKTYTFYQRVKETNTTYASESSAGTKVTTNKMSAIAPKAPTVASKTTNTVTLTKVTGCEYSKDGKTWQSSNVFKNLKAETEYTFYQRMAETYTSDASGKSMVLKVKTMPRESLVNEKGVWYYTVNDQRVNATTLVNYYGTWYYVEKGKVNWNCNTLYNYGGTYYYVKNGKVDWNCNTLCKYGKTWYYVQKGKINWNATTLCNYGGTWYYVEKGKVNFNATTLCNYGGTWYYVEKGKVNFNSTTLCKYGNTWYYVDKGKVNFNATTLCKYGNTWYYVHNGRVNFNATLRFKYYGKYYNVRNGVVKF